MSIEGLVIAGVLAGVLIGVFTKDHGCAVLLIIPVGMVAYTAVWQIAQTGDLRSTSALDYVFSPLWPSIGGVVGFTSARAIKSAHRWVLRKIR